MGHILCNCRKTFKLGWFRLNVVWLKLLKWFCLQHTLAHITRLLNLRIFITFYFYCYLHEKLWPPPSNGIQWFDSLSNECKIYHFISKIFSSLLKGFWLNVHWYYEYTHTHTFLLMILSLTTKSDPIDTDFSVYSI